MNPTQSRYVEMIEAIFHRHREGNIVRTDNPEVLACFYSQLQTIMTDIAYTAQVNLKLSCSSHAEYLSKLDKLDKMVEQYKIALSFLLAGVTIDTPTYTRLTEALILDVKNDSD